MALDIEVLKAQAQDLEGIKKLYDELIEANTGTPYDVLWRRDLHPSDASIEAAVAAGEMYIAIADGELVGAGILNQDFAQGYDSVPWTINPQPESIRCLHLFCTHPNSHGKGIGTAFLQGMFQHMRAQGVKAIRLDVFDYNAPAKRLYEKNGFTCAATTYLTYEDQEVCNILFAMYEVSLD